MKGDRWYADRMMVREARLEEKQKASSKERGALIQQINELKKELDDWKSIALSLSGKETLIQKTEKEEK